MSDPSLNPGENPLKAEQLSPRTRQARKGALTRTAILQTSLTLARHVGLDGLTIGTLADAAGMSKSGVFAHFGSREDLQIATLQSYESSFVAEVLTPALSNTRGLPRLLAIFDLWTEWILRESEHGCLYIAGATEYDDRPGPLRDCLVRAVAAWQSELSKALSLAIERGELSAEADLEQIVFEWYGLVLSLHHSARLMRQANSAQRARNAFRGLLGRYILPQGAARLQAWHGQAEELTLASVT